MANRDVSSRVVIRPKEVEYAIKLMLTVTVLGALVGYLNIPVSPDHDYFRAYTYLTLLGVLVNVYFVYKVAQNRDWARKAYISLTLVAFIFYLPQLLTVLASAPFNGVLQLISMAIQVTAIYFLLRKESKNWFLLVKRRK